MPLNAGATRGGGSAYLREPPMESPTTGVTGSILLRVTLHSKSGGELYFKNIRWEKLNLVILSALSGASRRLLSDYF